MNDPEHAKISAHVTALKASLNQCNTENGNVHRENIKLWKVVEVAKKISDSHKTDADCLCALCTALNALETRKLLE